MRQQLDKYKFYITKAADLDSPKMSILKEKFKKRQGTILDEK